MRRNALARAATLLATTGARLPASPGAVRFVRAVAGRAPLAALPPAMTACASSADAGADDGPEGFAFALVGDTPYGSLEARVLERLLGSLDEGIAFIVHVGDLKSGSSRCDDALLRSRRDLLARARRPLIFVPGDNDWTDCHRPDAGGYDPLERLARLRELFFDVAAPIGGKGLAVRQQAGWPENLQWQFGTVRFVSLNVPGSANGAGAQLPAAHQQARAAANRQWLAHASRQARRERAAGLVIAWHADPAIERGPALARAGGDPYASLRGWIGEAMLEYQGPVVLMHGDTHVHRFDRPWARLPGLAAPLRRLVRIECHGSPFSASWVRVAFHPATGRFSAASHALAFG